MYPHYVTKAEKKDRTKAEVDTIIRWLTGYSQKQLQAQLKKEIDFETFFAEAPKLNPSRELITGVVCVSVLKILPRKQCARFATSTS